MDTGASSKTSLNSMGACLLGSWPKLWFRGQRSLNYLAPWAREERRRGWICSLPGLKHNAGVDERCGRLKSEPLPPHFRGRLSGEESECIFMDELCSSSAYFRLWSTDLLDLRDANFL